MAQFVRAAAAEVAPAADAKLRHCTTSAVEGILALRAQHNLDPTCMDVTWVYAWYQRAIAAELRTSRQLSCKGLHEIVADVAVLCYGGLPAVQERLTATLFDSLTPQ